MTRKTMEIKISNEQAQKLFNSLTNLTGNEFAGVWFPGSLCDEFAVGMKDNTNWKINVKTGRPILGRKYVYAYEKYLNCWSSELVLVLTDSEKNFKKFIKSRFEEDENFNELDFEGFCYDCGIEYDE